MLKLTPEHALQGKYPLKLQTEHLPNHSARLTVELDAQQFDDARAKAARSLAKKVNIPGFRKGKAPYRILVNYVGEGAILEEAVELVSQDVYKAALLESGYEPYGPGSLDDVKLDVSPPTLIYSVPLQPTIDLVAYRDIRIDYVLPEVTDEQLVRAMKALQQEHAVIEDSARPVALDNRLTMAIHSYVVDAEDAFDSVEVIAAPVVDSEAEHDHDHDEEGHDHDHDHNDPIHDAMNDDQEVFLHEHAFQLVLGSDEEPAPGFSAALVGATVGETRIFTLALPAADADEDEEDEIDEKVEEILADAGLADDDDDEDAGTVIRFIVTVNKVESLTLPALTNDFAARVTANEEKPLSLLELRMRMRQELQKATAQQQDGEYATVVLSAMMEQASLAYPDMMVDEHVESLLEEFDERLKRQGLSLEDYKKINRKTKESLNADWRDAGVNSVKRMLMMQGLIDTERLVVDETAVEAEVDRFLSQFPDESREAIRQLVDRDASMRTNIRSNVLQAAVFDRVVAIGKGEAPPVSVVEPTVQLLAEPVAISEVIADMATPADDHSAPTPSDELVSSHETPEASSDAPSENEEKS